MKKLVVVLALVLLVGAIVLVALRPGSRGGDPAEPGGVVDRIGDLLPARVLAAADVAGQSCWSADTLTVPAGGACVTALPDEATKMTLCATAGVPDVRVGGATYGPQRVKASQLSCTDPRPISLYDDGSRMTVACLGTVPCRLKLV